MSTFLIQYPKPMTGHELAKDILVMLKIPLAEVFRAMSYVRTFRAIGYDDDMVKRTITQIFAPPD